MIALVDNSARITAAQKARGRPFKKGGDPRQGRGVKGKSGRKPDEFKAMCRALASSEEVEKAVVTALKNPKHPAFLGSLKWATEHGYGAPLRAVDVTSKGEQLTGVIILPSAADDE